MKKETVPPWLIVFLSLVVGALCLGVAWFFAPSDPTVSQAKLFSSEADPAPIRDVIRNIEDDTDLPSGTAVEVIVAAINVILAIFSVLLTAAAIWSGTLFLGSFGDEEKITKAKKILIWSLVGVAVTGVSYAFIYGVVNLEWNK